MVNKDQFEVEFVKSDQGGVVAATKVGRKYAFPDKRGTQPDAGDIWLVEIAGSNPSGSVYFLRCISRISTKAERDAVEMARRNRLTDLHAQRQALKPLLQEYVDQIQDWNFDNIDFEVSGIKAALTFSAARVNESEHGLVIRITPKVALLEGAVELRQFELTIDWDSFNVTRLWEERMGDAYAEVSAGHFGKFNVLVLPYAGEATFAGWKHDDKKLLAVMQIQFGGQSIVVESFVASVSSSGESPNIFVADNRKLPTRIATYVPAIPDSEMAWLEGVLSAELGQTAALKAAGILGISGFDMNNFTLLEKLAKERGFGGVGYSRKFQVPYLIHPNLIPLFDGLPGVRLIPAELVKNANESAWNEIQWTEGPILTVESAKELAGETREYVKSIFADSLLSEFREGDTLPGMITCRESGSGDTQYTYDVTVNLPHEVVLSKLHTFETYGFGRVPSETVEQLRPVTYEDVARGNVFFEGKSTVTVVAGRKGRRYLTWEAPETAEEDLEGRIEAMYSLVKYAIEGQVALTGYRYADTNNPIVLVNSGGTEWVVRELDTDAMSISKRKGAGSNKVIAYSLRQGEVAKAMRVYSEWQDITQDSNWQEVAGMLVEDILPQEIVAAFKGGK